MAIFFLFLIPSLPRYCSTHVSPILSILSFPSLLEVSKVWEALQASHSAQRKPAAEVGGDQIHLVPVISKVGEDVSHGSQRAAAPMLASYPLAMLAMASAPSGDR